MGVRDEFEDYVIYGRGLSSPYFPLFYGTMNYKGQVRLAEIVAADMYKDGEPLTGIFRMLTGPTFDLSKEVALTIIKQIENE